MSKIQDKFKELKSKNEKALISYIMTGFPNENTTLSVADGAAAVDGGDGNYDDDSGDHTGDILLNDDDNATYDSESLRVTRAKLDGGNYSSISAGGSQTVTGAYGTLTIYDNGRYSYAATGDAVEAITKDTTVNIF